MKYSGCHYKDGEEITGKGGTWEASIDNVKADKVKDEKLSKVVKKHKSKKMRRKARESHSKKSKKTIAAKHSTAHN